MKFSSTAASLACVAIVALSSASADSTPVLSTSSDMHHMQAPTLEQAMKAAQDADVPAGITLTGATEPIQMPAATTPSMQNTITGDGKNKQPEQEQWLGGLGGWGGLGWGGWGGFGPYRFGYSCGGIGGWAYPLGYWNAFGRGLWGGGCGLGLAYGGLFYC